MTPEVHTDSMQSGYAVRLKAFIPVVAGSSAPSIPDLIAAAGRIDGIDSADLSFPDHVESLDPRHLVSLLADNGMVLNGLAMRCYGIRRFAIGSFANPDRGDRRTAIDLMKRGIEALSEMNGKLMSIWPGKQGWISPYRAPTTECGTTPSTRSRRLQTTTPTLTSRSSTSRRSRVPTRSSLMPRQPCWQSGTQTGQTSA